MTSPVDSRSGGLPEPMRAGAPFLRSLPRVPPHVVVLGLVLAGIASAMLAFFVLPDVLVNDSRFRQQNAKDPIANEERRLKARNDVRTGGIQLIGALVIIVGGAFTWRTVWLTREGQITDRFAKAVEQLREESAQLGGRVGAIYALGRVARDSRADHPAVMAVLADHLRERMPAIDEYGKLRDLGPRSSVDPEVQAVALVLRNRRPHWDPQESRLDLSGIDLRLAPLHGVDLRGVDMRSCHLRGAYLSDGDLRGALLMNASLENANVQRAKLDQANLSGAVLRYMHAAQASLRGTDFDEAEFFQTEFEGANLAGAVGLPARLRERGLVKTDAATVWT